MKLLGQLWDWWRGRDARWLVASCVEHCNQVRLHSAIGYVTPADKLAGREREIGAARDRKLEIAREGRQQRRQALRTAGVEHQREASLGPGAAMSTPGLRERPASNHGAAVPRICA